MAGCSAAAVATAAVARRAIFAFWVEARRAGPPPRGGGRPAFLRRPRRACGARFDVTVTRAFNPRATVHGHAMGRAADWSGRDGARKQVKGDLGEVFCFS